MPAVSVRGISEDMAGAMDMILKNRQNYLRLGEKQLGKTGFYYIINVDGVIVFHPQLILVGKSFKDLWFMEPVLREKNGCIKYDVGGNRNVLFFKQINDTEILCMSIMEDEISGDMPECSVERR